MDQTKLDWLRDVGLIGSEDRPVSNGESSEGKPDGRGDQAAAEVLPTLDALLDSVLPPDGQNGRPGAGFPTGAATCHFDKPTDSVRVMIASYGGLDLAGIEVTLILWGKRGLLRLFKCSLAAPQRKNEASGTATYIATLPNIEAEIEKNGVSVDLANCQVEAGFTFPNGSGNWRGAIMGAPKGVDAPSPVDIGSGPGASDPHVWFREGKATCVWDQASDTLRATVVAAGGLDLAGATMYFEVSGPNQTSDQYECGLRVPIAVDRATGLAWYEGLMPEFGAAFARQNVRLRPKDFEVELHVVYPGGSARWTGPIKG